MMALKDCGQATVEYIFILAFALLLGFNLTKRFTNFFTNSMGGVGHVLSTHLTVGACSKQCWFDGYDNRYTGGATP